MPHVRSRSMKHHPEISRGYAHNLTDFFAGHLFHFTKSEDAGRPLREFAQTSLDYLSKLLMLEIPERVCSPIDGADVVMPVTGLIEEPGRVFRHGIGRVCRALAAGASKVVNYFVLEYSCEPCPFGRLSGEFVVRLKRGKQRFLHHLFGKRSVAQSQQRVAEKNVAMLFEPDIRL